MPLIFYIKRVCTQLRPFFEHNKNGCFQMFYAHLPLSNTALVSRYILFQSHPIIRTVKGEGLDNKLSMLASSVCQAIH